MTIQEIDKTYNRIIGFLNTKEIKLAFDYLQSLMAGSNDYACQEQLDQLQTTYQNMLRYRLMGFKDPMEKTIYQQVLSGTYQVADQLHTRLLTQFSSNPYYTRRRLRNGLPSSGLKEQYAGLKEQSAFTKEQDLLARRLFEQVWTAGFLTTDQREGLVSILLDRDMPDYVGCIIVSALLLGLQHFFDEQKVLLLMDAADIDYQPIRVRALICLLIVLYLYRERLAYYPNLSNRFSALSENHTDFSKLLRMIALQLITARETEKVSRKVRDEILPEMAKLHSKLDRYLNEKFDLKQLKGDPSDFEINPEWAEKMSQGKLGKAVQDLTEMQSEGADVLHSTFTHMKLFPFFQEISHWFIPFRIDHPDLVQPANASHTQFFAKLGNSPILCNSDKYSLYLGILEMPRELLNQMEQQCQEGFSSMRQDWNQISLSPHQQLQYEIRRYVEDLYRFYKLHPDHACFMDPFLLQLDIHNLPILQPYMSDKETLALLAESYLKKNHFEEALQIYSGMCAYATDDAILYQKIGYCKQMLNDLTGALEAYQQSDLIHSNSKWVIRRIGNCYRSLKQPAKALEYYQRYEQQYPDDLPVQISIGHCYLELKNYAQALHYFFKVDYLDPNHKAWRPIAWCSFLTGKYDQARNYYQKILEWQPTAQDYLNAGHTEWVLQNTEKSLQYYKQAVKALSGDIQQFRELFDQDLPDLLAAGIESEEIPLMIDQLHYVIAGTL
ncbi:MAG: tetratricopeptide repeat protein [Parabacteroides sp.]|nr:tetratricopeptide repeat protein [Parabacteroides sp.]